MESKRNTSNDNIISGFSLVNDDITRNILSRLPATSFASAACVSRCWNKVCGQILNKPKLASALSLNASIQDAVKEVLDKVLSEPIRPHFVIACIARHFRLGGTHQLDLLSAHVMIVKKFGSRVPVITNLTSGIIGIDALTNELTEVNWDGTNEDDSDGDDPLDRGISLIVGFIPGLKVDIIPLLTPITAPNMPIDERFLVDIRNFVASVSNNAFATGIILFGSQEIDMRSILSKMDSAMPEETIIIGDASGTFLFARQDTSQNYYRNTYYVGAVALVFAEDKRKRDDVGKILFNVTCSTSLIPFGPHLKVFNVLQQPNRSWINVVMEGCPAILNGQEILDNFFEQLEDEEDASSKRPELYVGISTRRMSSDGLRSGLSVAFYRILDGDNGYLVIDGIGIKPDESFLLFHTDPESASLSLENVNRVLAIPKTEQQRANKCHSTDQSNITKKEVIGGLIFCCDFCSETYKDEEENLNSLPFYENFPGVPLSGIFGKKGIARSPTSLGKNEYENEENTPRCCLNVCGTMYLVMEYVPPPSQPYG